MRWKESGINYASGTVKIIGVDPFICTHNNGTEICGSGHKLSVIGRCRSQSLGKSNSTDDAFQPDYSICTADYEREGSDGHILAVSDSVASNFSISTDTTCSGLSSCVLRRTSVDKNDSLYAKEPSKDGGHTTYVIPGYEEGSGSVYHRTAGKITFYDFLQRDSGYVFRKSNAFSDLFDLDIFGYATIIQPYFYTLKKSVCSIINKVALNSGYGHVLASGIEISSPSLDGENPTDICVGDQTPPEISNIVPSRDSVLVAADSTVSFDVTDSTGGVKKSSLYITVSGSTTTQLGGYSIVEAGVVQVPDYATLGGTQTRYTFTYAPPADWAQNETVYITITGSDNKPLDGDEEEFVCSGDVNTFYDSWDYKVLNTSDFCASITAIADSSAPYLDSILPTPYLGYTDALSEISFYIKDDLSGVDLNTLNIYINETRIIRQGTTVVSGAAVSGTPSSYYFTYSPSSGFSYGTRIIVRVVVSDLYAASPNELDYSYYFDVVSDSTVVFENFIPEVGITWNPELLDIEVDVIDRVYDIDTSDLYLSINGDVCSSVVTPLYGNRELTSTVSGVDYICGSSLDNVVVIDATVSGATISGADIYDGMFGLGELGSGFIYGFSAPFDDTPISFSISGSVFEGTLISGAIDTALVSGVNWDGNYYNSTIYGVDLSAVYASDVCTSGTIISGTIGAHLSYHPDNDFNYSGNISVLVHGTNNSTVSPVTRETVYNLLHGYNIKSFDRVFKHSSRVNVFVGADNSEDFTNSLAYGFYFDTIDQQSNDMYASITGISPWVDLSASISPQAPVHMYGKTMEVILYAADLEGNELEYSFSYTIEER